MDNQFLLECTLRILASFAAGFILGLERKFRQQVVGMRTLILISVSSTLLSILSIYMAEHFKVTGDPTRIAAGVVSGIGFLGGGAILRQGMNIKGLTSAAIIWTASALGMTIGAGLYLQALITLIVCVLSLVLLERVEVKYFPAARTKIIRVIYEDDTINSEQVKNVINSCGFIVQDVNISKVIEKKRVRYEFLVKAPKDENFSEMVEKLKHVGKLKKFVLSD